MMRTGYMREFSKEEAVMSNAKRVAAVTNRMRQEVQADAPSIGHEYQKAAERGFEAAGRSFTEANKAIQAIAIEMTDFSKRRFEDVWHSWEQLLSARSFGDVVEVQARFAQKARDAYTSEMSKLGKMYLNTIRNAAKPVEEVSRRVS
jgi:hypothetical protein